MFTIYNQKGRFIRRTVTFEAAAKAVERAMRRPKAASYTICEEVPRLSRRKGDAAYPQLPATA